MNLLTKIITHKQQEIAVKRKNIPLKSLLESPFFSRPIFSLEKAILTGNGIITEFKRKSPSAGIIGEENKLESILKEYQAQNAVAYSILTDQQFFGGSIMDIENVRNMLSGPILRKDFIIDEYQIFEAKAAGADAILLIAEALDEYHATYLATIAKSIGLEVLMEFHSADELHKLNENVDVIGVNNRNLKTLKTDIRKAFEMAKRLPFGHTKIAESGISSPFEIEELLAVGYNGFLIGESILKNEGLLNRLIKAANHSKQLQL